MRAWAKRMIWFFGFWFMIDLEMYLLNSFKLMDNFDFIGLVFIWWLPLILMKDDKKKRRGIKWR